MSYASVELGSTDLGRAAQLAAIDGRMLTEWIDDGLIDERRFALCSLRPAAVHSQVEMPWLLTLLLIKLLQANGVSAEAIRPMSRFLAERTFAEILDGIRRGQSVLLALGDQVTLAPPGCQVRNESSAAVHAIAVDLAILTRHAELLIQRHKDLLLRN